MSKKLKINSVYAFYGALEGGHLKLAIKLCSYTSKEMRNGNYYAAKSGNLDCIRFTDAYTEGNTNLKGLEGACEGGHMEIFKYLYKPLIYELNHLLKCAAKGGNIEIVKFLISQGADDIELLLSSAEENWSIEIAILALEYGAKNLQDLDFIDKVLAFTNYKRYNLYYNGIMNDICRSKKNYINLATHIIKYLNRGSIRTIALEASIYGNDDVLELAMENGAEYINE